MKKLIVIIALMACGNAWAADYTFGQYAADAGLTGNETTIDAENKGITDLPGLANNYDDLIMLDLGKNQITSIESGSFHGLTNLTTLRLEGNQLTSIESGAFGGLASLRQLHLNYNQIASIESGAFNELTNLEDLDLHGNQITSIESGAFGWLANLTGLYLSRNQIGTMDLSGWNLSSLTRFNIDNNPLTSVLLTDVMLGQEGFNAIMDGGSWLYDTGIAELPGVLSLDMSGVDFSMISNLSSMYTMDDLEELLLIDAINLAGSDVAQLTIELDSLNFLDVTGLWDTFNITSRDSLNMWGDIESNTLVTPEPTTLSLLAIGALLLRRKRKA